MHKEPKTVKQRITNGVLAEPSQSFDGTANDLAEAKRSSVMHKTTASHFFGAPTGADLFGESINSAFTRKVQPPMVMGKAKVPSDLHCVLQSASRQKHQTVDHTRTHTSFVNESLRDYRPEKMSPLDISSNRVASGRQSTNTKPFKNKMQTD